MSQTVEGLLKDVALRMPNGVEERYEDGWTVIGRGKNYKPKFVHGIDKPMEGLTVKHLSTDFNAKSKQWRSSTCRRATLDILDKQHLNEEWHIDKAVCLATSSFSRDNWQARQRSMMQWAAFFDIVQHLQSKVESAITTFAQEPMYTPLDRQFLEILGVRVLDADHGDKDLGEAVQHLGPSTFVLEAFMDLGYEAIQGTCEGDPALYIGSSMKRALETWQRRNPPDLANSAEEDKAAPGYVDQVQQPQSVADFVASRRSYRMPRFEEDPNVFEGLHIYWKEPHDDSAIGG